MKPILFILPFLAILFGAFGTAMGSAFPEAAWLTATGWGSAAALIIAWVVLDAKNFKAFFARKGTKYGAGSGLVVILTMLIIVGVGVLTSKPRFNKSFDVTKNKSNTLSDQSLKILENIAKTEKPVQITGYFQSEEAKQQFGDMMAMYTPHDAKFEIEYVDPLRDRLRAEAEKITAGNTVVVKFGTRESRVSTFTEEKFTNALVKVLKEGSKKIYFTKGHGEGQPKGSEATGFSQLVGELEGNQYVVEELALLEEAKVPDGADLVIIAGPKYDFKVEETRMLEDYLKRGGAVLAMTDGMTSIPNLNASLAKFGIEFNNDLLVLDSQDPRAMMIGQNFAIISEFDDFNPVSRDFAKQSRVEFLMPSTRSVREVTDNPNNMKVTLAAKTSKIMIRIKDVHREEDLKGLTRERVESGQAFPVVAVASGKPVAPATANATGAGDDGDTKSDVLNETAAPEATSREIRVVGIGSSAFASNAGAAAAENRDLFMNAVNYLLKDEDFIAIRPKDPTKSSLSLTSGASQFSLSALAFIYPFVFLGAGLMFWFSRRHA